MTTSPIDRVPEVKARVESLKARVRTLQAALGEARALAEGQWPRQPRTWQAYQQAKRDYASALNDLSAAKVELTTLSGVTGSDPRWRLLCEAWYVLSTLDEAGVDIGERGHALIDDIEFHVPHSKLHETGPLRKGAK